MLNKIALMGRFTKHPELRYTQSQTPVTSFTLAVERDYPDKDTGDRQTDFINCVAWRNTAEFVEKYFDKGRMAVVSGRLEIRNFKDRNGDNRQSAEVVVDNIYFADSKPQADPDSTPPTQTMLKELQDDSGEELPF